MAQTNKVRFLIDCKIALFGQFSANSFFFLKKMVANIKIVLNIAHFR